MPDDSPFLFFGFVAPKLGGGAPFPRNTRHEAGGFFMIYPRCAAPDTRMSLVHRVTIPCDSFLALGARAKKAVGTPRTSGAGRLPVVPLRLFFGRTVCPLDPTI